MHKLRFGLIGGAARGEADHAQRVYEMFLKRATRDDEFHDWQAYRTELTDFILSGTPAGGALLILGAGQCSDLDLGRLSEHAGSIVLSDYREASAKQAAARYGLTFDEWLRFEKSDYVGIPDEDYLEYTRLLLEAMEKLARTEGDSLEQIAPQELLAVQELLEEIYRANQAVTIDLGAKAYDSAVVCGVHSQLNNAFRGIFQFARKDTEESLGEVKFAEELNAAIFQTTRRYTESIVRRFNAALFAAARDTIIYGYEEHIIYTPQGEDHPVMGTVDGARQAGEMIADLPVRNRLETIWPLSRRRGIQFEMTVCQLPAMPADPEDA